MDVEKARRVAARVAAVADIEDVRLLSSRASLRRFPDQGAQLRFSIQSTARVDYDEGDSAFVATYEYGLTISEAVVESEDSTPEATGVPSVEGDDSPGGAGIAEIVFQLGALCSLAEPDGGRDPFGTDEVRAYTETTIQFALYPYAREYIYDVTGRMGLPALTLPVMRIHLPEVVASSAAP